MKNETDIITLRVRTKEHTELHFYDEVYRMYVIVLVCSYDGLQSFLDRVGYRPEYRKTMNDDSSGFCIQLDEETTTAKGQRCIALWMRQRDLPCLVHELAHLTMITFDQKDVAISVENQEPFTYYLEHWFKRITEVWKVPAKARPKRDPKQLALMD